MKEQYISFETAKLAKEKGFELKGSLDEYSALYNSKGEEQILQYYQQCYNLLEYSTDRKEEFFIACTQSLLQKWLREVHNIDVLVGWGGDWISDLETHWDNPDFQESEIIIHVNGYQATYSFINKITISPENTDVYSTFEEALEEGLKEALKLI